MTTTKPKKEEKVVKTIRNEVDEREMVDETVIQRAERKMMEDYDGYPHTVAIREVFLQYLDKELAELYSVLPNGAVISCNRRSNI